MSGDLAISGSHPRIGPALLFERPWGARPGGRPVAPSPIARGARGGRRSATFVASGVTLGEQADLFMGLLAIKPPGRGDPGSGL